MLLGNYYGATAGPVTTPFEAIKVRQQHCAAAPMLGIKDCWFDAQNLLTLCKGLSESFFRHPGQLPLQLMLRLCSTVGVRVYDLGSISSLAIFHLM